VISYWLSQDRGSFLIKLFTPSIISNMRTQPLFTGYLQNKYHYCGRCSNRAIIAQMKWQNGVLLCPDCIDTMLPQERDAALDRAVAVAATSEEGQIDKKLTEGATIDADEVSFIP